jgi:hypothetical protein
MRQMNAAKTSHVYSNQQLAEFLKKRYPRLNFMARFKQTWWERLIGYPRANFCCGGIMMEFTAYYETSGLKADTCFYACQFCGRTE